MTESISCIYFLLDSVPMRLLKVLCRYFEETPHHNIGTLVSFVPKTDDLSHFTANFSCDTMKGQKKVYSLFSSVTCTGTNFAISINHHRGQFLPRVCWLSSSYWNDFTRSCFGFDIVDVFHLRTVICEERTCPSILIRYYIWSPAILIQSYAQDHSRKSYRRLSSERCHHVLWLFK